MTTPKVLRRIKKAAVRPIVVHDTTKSVLTIGGAVTFILHWAPAPWEALAFFLTGTAAVWAEDIERAIRHPHFHFQNLAEHLKEREEDNIENEHPTTTTR